MSRVMPEAVAWTTSGDASLHLRDVERRSASASAAASTASAHAHANWEPYDFNGGTVLAIAGSDFVVVAGDTRLSTGYSVLSRRESKLHALNATTVLGCPGSHNDVLQLRGVLDIRAQMYAHDNKTAMSASATAQLLMNTLYARRFFPYYAFCILCGLDEDGRGVVYTYDAIGSYDRVTRAAQGSGGHLMIPLLDNLVEHDTRADPKKELTLQETKDIIKDAFVTAGERDIYTGDSVEIWTIQASGITSETFALKKD